MKIGFVISFLDFRNDIRKTIEVLQGEHHIVIFTTPAFHQTITEVAPPGCEIRLINERVNHLKNRTIEYYFHLFKKLPVSRENYFLMEAFKISNLQSTAFKKMRARGVLIHQRVTPRCFSYDAYLDMLSYSSATSISDIDQFIFTTEILDDYLFVRVLRENKPLNVYVYSWDHPCKHTRFSKRVQYKVWNDSMKADLIRLQGIAPDHIEVASAGQFGFIYNFLQQSHEEQETEPFIYYGCAIGIEQLAAAEIQIIMCLADALKATHPGWKLVVRPYPVLNNWKIYEPLKSISNIQMDDQFRTSNLSVNETAIYDKYNMIRKAKAFFHLGTTLGLEACHTSTPVFMIDDSYAGTNKSLHHFIHQYQNEKYFVEAFPDNILRTTEEVKQALLNLDDDRYKKPNLEIPLQFPAASFETFAKQLIR